ncbi:hypothetical protein AC1031_010946 [Aphanomyces cochlioides]|nr:hypothetical protein AC1031_010946 [Aphanomyces cochlioides]
MDIPVLMHGNGCQSVFVRPCYDELFKLLLEDIDERKQTVGITGHPGIGISRFYAYCVFRLTQEPILGRILVINCCQQTRIFEDGAFPFISTDEELLLYQDDKDVIRLIDGRSNNLFSWTGMSILFSSTNYCDYNSFLKSTYVQYVMPPWTEKELCIAAQVAGITIEEVQDCFQVFGGIARFVFSKEWDAYFIDATEAFASVRWLEIFNEVRLKEVNEKKYPHRLLHMFPQHARSRAYCGSYVNLGSNYIA